METPKKVRSSKRILKMKNYVLNNDNLQFEEKPTDPNKTNTEAPKNKESQKELIQSEEFPDNRLSKKSSEESFLRPTKLLSDLGQRTHTIKEVDEEQEIEQIKEIKEDMEDEDIKEDKSDFKPLKSNDKPPVMTKFNPFLQKISENKDDFQLDIEESKNSVSSQIQEIKKVAILGACGFLGYKVTKLLLEKGYQVVMGIPEDNSNEDKELIRVINDQYGEDQIEVFEFDFFDSKKSDELLRGCQALVHCARVRRKYI